MPTLHALRRFKYLITALGSIAAGLAGAEPVLADGSRLYAPCVACHQPNAWGSPDGTIPNLAGQQRRYLEKQMSVFRAGARVDAAMQIVAKHPTFGHSQTITALATYLSDLDANPKPVIGAGDHLRLGKELFTYICAACHGVDGRGGGASRAPRIGGQHYPYLRAQIDAAAELHKDLAPPEMSGALRGMRTQEKDALADYVSRLGTSTVLANSNDDTAFLRLH
jgi:cytochrome c553